VMTRPARHLLRATELRAVDLRDHLDHPASGLLELCVDDPIDLVAARAGVAVGAIEAQGRRNDAHTADEIIDAQFLERAGRHVLESLAGFFPGRCGRDGALTTGLSRRPDGPYESAQPHAYKSSDC